MQEGEFTNKSELVSFCRIMSFMQVYKKFIFFANRRNYRYDGSNYIRLNQKRRRKNGKGNI